MADFGAGHAGVHHGRRDRVVQVDGHAFVDRHGGVGHHPGHRGGQQNAHLPLVVGQHAAPQESPEDQGPGQQPSPRQFVPRRVGHLPAPQALAADPEELSGGDHASALVVLHRFHLQVLHCEAHLVGLADLVHRPAKADRHRIGPPTRPLPEELAPLKAEKAPPKSAKVDRDHRGVGPFENPQETRPKRVDLPGPAQTPFRKNAHQIPLLDRLLGRAKRPHD